MKLTSSLVVTRHGKDGTARPIGRHQLGRSTRRRYRDDGRGQAVDRGFDGGKCSCVRNVGRTRSQQAQFLEELLVVDGRFRLAGNLVHRLDGLPTKQADIK
jgi:hypothetical protein